MGLGALVNKQYRNHLQPIFYLGWFPPGLGGHLLLRSIHRQLHGAELLANHRAGLSSAADREGDLPLRQAGHGFRPFGKEVGVLPRRGGGISAQGYLVPWAGDRARHAKDWRGRPGRPPDAVHSFQPHSLYGVYNNGASMPIGQKLSEEQIQRALHGVYPKAPDKEITA